MSDAEYFQSHKDDPDEWGEPEPPSKSTEKRRLASMVSVRLSPDESETIRRVAAKRDMTLSAFMRNAALAAAGVVSAPSGYHHQNVRVETRTVGSSDQPGTTTFTLRESVTAAA